MARRVALRGVLPRESQGRPCLPFVDTASPEPRVAGGYCHGAFPSLWDAGLCAGCGWGVQRGALVMRDGPFGGCWREKPRWMTEVRSRGLASLTPHFWPDTATGTADVELIQMWQIRMKVLDLASWKSCTLSKDSLPRTPAPESLG